MKSLGPSMPLYVDDFLGGTQHFDAAQIGGYILLLLQQWQQGYVDENVRKLMHVSRLKRHSQLEPILAKFYVDSDGHLRNRRLELIRAERMDYIKTQSEKGKWDRGNHGSTAVPTVVSTGGQPEVPSPSPSPILIHTQATAKVGFTLQECLDASQSIGMPRHMVEAFFNHYDRFDWIGSQNRRITRLHSALAKWKQDQANFQPRASSLNKQPRETLSPDQLRERNEAQR